MKRNKTYRFFYKFIVAKYRSTPPSRPDVSIMLRHFCHLLKGLSNGLTTYEAAAKYGINRRTAEKNLADMKQAVGAKNIHHLIAIAIRTKLIK